MTKDSLTHLVEQLPDTFSLEDVLDRIILLAKIERGLEQSNQNETLTQNEVKQRLAKWFK